MSPLPKGLPRKIEGIEPLPKPDAPPSSREPEAMTWVEERAVRVHLRRSADRTVLMALGDTDLHVGLVVVTWDRLGDPESAQPWRMRQLYAVGLFWNVAGFALNETRPGVWSPGERTLHSRDELPAWLREVVEETRPPL